MTQDRKNSALSFWFWFQSIFLYIFSWSFSISVQSINENAFWVGNSFRPITGHPRLCTTAAACCCGNDLGSLL